MEQLTGHDYLFHEAVRKSLDLTPELYAEYLDVMAAPMSPALDAELRRINPTCRDQVVWVIARWVEKTYGPPPEGTTRAAREQAAKTEV